ncbi:MAG: Crp/Fnr family transcriptional regulator [Rubrivivax sp.]
MHPSDEAIDSREQSRHLALELAPFVKLSERPLLQISAGTTLMWAGERFTRIAFLETGLVNAVLHLHGAEGGQVIPISFGGGEVVALSRLFGNEPGQLDLVAATDLRLRWVPKTEVEQALLQRQDLLVLLVRFLAARLREVQSREAGWLERGVRERVCATLVRLARESTPLTGARWLIDATHEDLAVRCGVSRPKVSGELKRLEKIGLLRLGRGVVEILDSERLLGGS